MQQQVDPHSPEQTPAASKNDAPRGPVLLSADLLELVSGGGGGESPRGGWKQTEERRQLDGEGGSSPRGGW